MNKRDRMTRETFGTALDSGYITSYTLDLLEKSFVIHVDVLENSVLTTYEVSFSGLSAFTFSDEKAHQWERLEITEVLLEDFPDRSLTKEWRVWFDFWDVAELSLRCAAIRVNGTVLA